MKTYYIEKLEAAFQEKRMKNPMYSVRAFARHLKIDPGLLSSILRQKRVPSKAVAQTLSIQLKLDDSAQWAFLRSVDEQRRTDKELKAARSMTPPAHSVAEVTQDQFARISRWYHPAIVTLTRLENFDEDPAKISKRLGITLKEAQQALTELLDAGVLFRAADGKLSSREKITIIDKKESSTEILKLHQKELLERSSLSIDTVPYGKRYHMGTALAIDPDKLPEARKMLEEFMRSLSIFLESNHQKNLYQFSAALFPLEKINHE